MKTKCVFLLPFTWSGNSAASSAALSRSMSSWFFFGLPLFDFEVVERTPLGKARMCPASVAYSTPMWVFTLFAVKPLNPFKYPRLTAVTSVRFGWLPKLAW